MSAPEQDGDKAAFAAFPLGSVRPEGWLRNQLRVQASGLTGRIEEVWEDLDPARSAWRGGTGESWERGPYYLDGLVALAHVLDDTGLKERAQPWLSWMLASQKPDGSFGPPNPETRWGANWWYTVPALKALMQHHEATGDEAVVPFMLRYFGHQARSLEARPLAEWGRARAGEIDLCIQWLAERTGHPDLKSLQERLRAQALDWTREFLEFRWERLPEPFAFRHETHVVNVAMGLKSPALWWLWTGREEDRLAPRKGLEALTRHHGQANGTFSGDEHLSGRDPVRGTELCAVVELMFSLEHLLRITGDPVYGDRLEQVAYNALPAAFDRLMLVHQYDQQVNQVLCTEARRPWVNNGDRANVFGLEPNFGCCTANYHQGWPKLAAHAWMRARDGGAVAAVLGPSRLSFTTPEGAPATIESDTDYPFGERVVFRVRCKKAVHFPLHVRIPAWCPEPVVDGRRAEPGTFHRLERRFQDGDEVVVELPRSPRREACPGGGTAVHLGPLLLALPLPFAWCPLPGEPELHGDREARPTGPWNLALDLRNTDLEALRPEVPGPGPVPFDDQAPPLRLRVPAGRLPTWGYDGHNAQSPPATPRDPAERRESVDLVPYGATVLRVGVLPALRGAGPR